VLSLVVERPGHGYEIWQRYDERFGSLMPVVTSRIYKALDRLEEQGLVERIAGGGEGSVAQPKPKFVATAAGTQRHRAWIAKELRTDPIRDEVLQRVLAATVTDTSALLDVVSRYERACIEESDALPAMPTREAHSAYAILDGLRQQLLAEEKRLILDARFQWSAYARRKIRTALAELRALDDA
jgi:DNA-binding PadR family transcriptional regulator